MQPDDIILQKQWHQLSADERKIVESLANDEAEYNLLRSMLLVVNEEKTEVPILSPLIKQNILNEFPKKAKVKSLLMYKLSVAAAILFIAFSIWIFYNNSDNTGNKNTLPVAEIKPPHQQNQQTPDTVLPQKESELTGKTQTTPTTVATNNKSIQNNTDTLTRPNHYAAVNTTIRENEELLELITEVY